MPMMKAVIPAWAILIAAGTLGTETATDVPEIGIKIGEAAPEIRLNDQSGRKRSLDDFGKEKGIVALLFFRSADW